MSRTTWAVALAGAAAFIATFAYLSRFGAEDDRPPLPTAEGGTPAVEAPPANNRPEALGDPADTARPAGAAAVALDRTAHTPVRTDAWVEPSATGAEPVEVTLVRTDQWIEPSPTAHITVSVDPVRTDAWIDPDPTGHLPVPVAPVPTDQFFEPTEEVSDLSAPPGVFIPVIED